MISSALRRVCFAILLCESDTCGKAGARPETPAMQLARTFPRNPLGIETFPSNMPESCLGTAIKDILIMMFYIVHKDSAKCAAVLFFFFGWQAKLGWRKPRSVPLNSSSVALLKAEGLFL